MKLVTRPSQVRTLPRKPPHLAPCALIGLLSVACGGTDSSHAPRTDAGDAGRPTGEPGPNAPSRDAAVPTRDAGERRPNGGVELAADGGNGAGTGADSSAPPGVDAGPGNAAPEDAGSLEDAGASRGLDASARDAGAPQPVEAGPPPLLETVVELALGGSPCGLAFSSQTGRLWLYPCSGAELLAYDVDGEPLLALPRPGESANDVDIDIAPRDLSLAGVAVPAGSLLFVNGESGPAEIYALDPETGAVLATLETAFGSGHVVGAAYHPLVPSIFAVQDRVPGDPDGNVVAALEPESGALISSWSSLPHFDVNYGDLDVCASTGNLMLVSSNENGIAEFTPDGTFVGSHALPSGVAGLSGISLDDASGRVWAGSNSGGVWSFTGGPCSPMPD